MSDSFSETPSPIVLRKKKQYTQRSTRVSIISFLDTGSAPKLLNKCLLRKIYFYKANSRDQNTYLQDDKMFLNLTIHSLRIKLENSNYTNPGSKQKTIKYKQEKHS